MHEERQGNRLDRESHASVTRGKHAAWISSDFLRDRQKRNPKEWMVPIDAEKASIVDGID